MKEKGITLTTLAITIVIMGIIASITITAGTEVIRSTNLKKFTTELTIIQNKFNEQKRLGLNEEEFNEIGQNINSLNNQKQNQIENAINAVTNTTDTDGYIYLNKTNLEKIGVVGIDREVVINFSEFAIIDINGTKNEDNQMIYAIP